MDPTRWKRIETIYQSALEQPAEERPVFLRGACEGDEGLLREVEEMLEARVGAQRILWLASRFARSCCARGVWVLSY